MNLIRPLYKRISRQSRLMQAQWDRGEDVLRVEREVNQFRRYVPERYLKKVTSLSTPLQPIIRSIFKQTPCTPQSLGQGFELYKVLGRRLTALSKLVYTSSSETVTGDIYIGAVISCATSNATGEHIFFYTITIKNYSESKTYQLLTRHWEISDSNGDMQTVDGPGVVGKTPVLAPGQEHKYTSSASLKSPVGVMSGSYGMKDVQSGEEFKAIILPFGLIFETAKHLSS
eukprot:TRINITY_DN6227_c0_g1_i1.p1 TRINITY_DN6227_c0_g1~~TRINITY_DN6227_c0_g1_i1.p1  ORF type:complete len:241 (-),score=19.61 TRINITY_DN6227_c0_g1_i1:110-796(-)